MQNSGANQFNNILIGGSPAIFHLDCRRIVFPLEGFGFARPVQKKNLSKLGMEGNLWKTSCFLFNWMQIVAHCFVLLLLFLLMPRPSGEEEVLEGSFD